MQDDPSQMESWNPYGYEPDTFAAAREQLRSAQLDDESNPSPEYRLAKQLQRQKSVLAAKEFVRQKGMTGELASLLEVLPPKSSAPLIQSSERSNLGRVLSKGGKPLDAVEALLKAIELNDGNINAHYHLSLVYFDLHNTPGGDADEDYLAKSLARAEGALKRAPNRGDVEAHIGEIYLALGDRKTALKHFKRAVKHSPDNDGLRLQYKALIRHPILNWFVRKWTNT